VKKPELPIECPRCSSGEVFYAGTEKDLVDPSREYTYFACGDCRHEWRRSDK